MGQNPGFARGEREAMRPTRLPGRRKIRGDFRALCAVMAAATLAGCSSVPNYANPIEWYRDITGVSKNDAEDQGARNSANLESGGNEPYPNLATVPQPPDTAMSTVDREKLQQGLVADRANARYSDQQLQQGKDVPPLPGTAPKVALAPPSTEPPPLGPAPATTAPQGSGQAQPTKGSAPPPQESAVVPPSIANLPQGQQPRAAPPPPSGMQPARQVAAASPPPSPPTQPPSQPTQSAATTSPPPQVAVPSPPPKQVAALPPPLTPLPTYVDPALEPSVMRTPGGKRAAVTLEAAEIAFSGGTKTLSPSDSQRLSETAALQKQGGGSLRIIGYAARGSGPKAAEQELQSFGDALDRANAVAAELTRLGVPTNRITVQAAPAMVEGGLPPGQVVVLLEY
jgi:outer membrane protein OmpA-like peptidoglycan-associated protein